MNATSLSNLALAASFAAFSAACSDTTGPDTTPTTKDSGVAVDSSVEVVNGCTAFIDATADEAKRTLAWGLALAPVTSCIKITLGQTVTWKPDSSFEDHPLVSFPPQSGSPIQNGSGSSLNPITFDKAGLYGYHCDFHSSMKGAILVVP